MMMRRISPLLLFLLFFTAVPVFSQSKPDALVLYRQGRYREAISVCMNELRERPYNIESHVVISWSYLRLQDYDSVLKYGLDALKITKYDARIMEILGEAYFYKDKNTESLKYFQEYVNLNPSGSLVSDVYYFMGELFIRLGEYNHADIAYSTAVYHSPNVAKWWGRLGYAREMAKEYQAALDAYDRALKLNARLDEAVRGKERLKALL